MLAYVDAGCLLGAMVAKAPKKSVGGVTKAKWSPSKSQHMREPRAELVDSLISHRGCGLAR